MPEPCFYISNICSITFAGDECYHPCQYNSDGIKNEEDETAGLYFCFGTAANSTRKGCGYYPKEDRQGHFVYMLPLTHMVGHEKAFVKRFFSVPPAGGL